MALMSDISVNRKSPVYRDLELLYILIENGILQPKHRFKNIIKNIDKHIHDIERENMNLRGVKKLEEF